MIEQEREKLRAVAWSEVMPWLSLFRTFRLAIRIRALLLGTVAILLTMYGWTVIDWAFSGGQPLTNAAGKSFSLTADAPWKSLTDESLVPNRPGFPINGDVNPVEPISGVWRQLSSPFVRVFSPETGFVGLVQSLAAGLWAVLIWAWFGGALTRSAALELAADERVGTQDLLDFVKRRWRAYLAAPLFPLLGVLLATVGIFVAGLLLNAGLTAWISAIVWPLLLVGGLMMAVLLLGLCFGWPLMWPTISSEGTDSFDALSRTYAYVFQKPLHYLFYVVVAALFGMLGWLLVSNFAAAVISLTDWAAGWGCGAERFGKVVQCEPLGWGTGAALLIYVWRCCVKLVAVGFLYSYFWTAATAIYFLLRRDVDATEMDEIYVEDENADEVYGLPKIGADEQGAPTVDASPENQPAETTETKPGDGE